MAGKYASFSHNVTIQIRSCWTNINADTRGVQSPVPSRASKGANACSSKLVLIETDVFTVWYAASVGLVNVSLGVKGAVYDTCQSNWICVQSWRTHGNTVTGGPISILVKPCASGLTFSCVIVLDGILISWTLSDTLSGVQIGKTIVRVIVFCTRPYTHVDRVVSVPVVGQGAILIASLVGDVPIKSVRTLHDTSVIAKEGKKSSRTKFNTCTIYCSSWHVSILIHRWCALGDTFFGCHVQVWILSRQTLNYTKLGIIIGNVREGTAFQTNSAGIVVKSICFRWVSTGGIASQSVGVGEGGRTA